MVPMAMGSSRDYYQAQMASNASLLQNAMLQQSALGYQNTTLTNLYARHGRRERVMSLLRKAYEEVRDTDCKSAWSDFNAVCIRAYDEFKESSNHLQPAKRGFGGGSAKRQWAF